MNDPISTAKIAVLETAFGLCAEEEGELFKRLESLYWKGALHSQEKWSKLYITINEMMAPLGMYGTISARDDRVQAVMDALHDIDGGIVPP